MLAVDRIAALRSVVRDWRARGDRIGFVPTMGSLHAGHMSLLATARFRAERVVASIFVNPLQFGPGEDYERYPRTPEEDSRLLEQAGCDLLFSPTVNEMYPQDGLSATRVSVQPLSGILDGAFRPGHFDGVATVVARLFGIVQPDVAVFGEKDYQQLAVVRRMSLDLALPVEIVGAPTVRSADGLAMSSRNKYLTADERAVAPRIHATLRAMAARIDAGEPDLAALETWGAQQLADAGMKVDYCAVRDALSLVEPAPSSRELVILVAARLGKARLIDNLRVARAGAARPS